MIGQRSQHRRRLIDRPAQQGGETRRAAIRKGEGFNHERAIGIGRVEVREHKLVRFACAHPDSQRPGHVILREGEIVSNNPRSELNPVPLADRRDIFDPVGAVAEIEKVGIVARTSNQSIA